MKPYTAGRLCAPILLALQTIVPFGAVHAAAAAAADQAVGGSPGDAVFYVGGAGDQAFRAVLPLSDGTLLLGGGAGDLGWLPDGTPVTELAGDRPESMPTGRHAVLLHVTGDLSGVLRACVLPKGVAGDITAIKTTTATGEPTGAIYISGLRDGEMGEHGADKPRPGYFIARLDGNFVNAPATELQWVANPWHLGEYMAWDVGGDGKVVYTAGRPHGYDWFQIARLTADGKPDIVPQWRNHWVVGSDGKRRLHFGTADTAEGEVLESAIITKRWTNAGALRSWNKEDFLQKSPDGNGGVKQGRWPMDAMHPGYFDPDTKKTVPVLDGKKGYYGYRNADNSPPITAVVVDRRTNDIYFGGNNQSRLPDGLPDFEPWVVAMEPDGGLRWWQRLYPESKGVSTPDQYVDALAIDYRRPPGEGTLVVAARCHGNNVNNFFNPADLTHPDASTRGFQKRFTGREGNIHISWLGRLTLADGRVMAATWLAEYPEGRDKARSNKPFADPNLDHWPDINDKWPNVNTTRLIASEGALAVDGDGRVYIVAKGRRVITTRNAFMQGPSNLGDKVELRGQWSDFLRVYSPDLSTVEYSTILKGSWDWQTGEGASEVNLMAVAPLPGGLVAVGQAPVGKSGAAEGNPMPTRSVQAWGAADRTGEDGVVAKLKWAE